MEEAKIMADYEKWHQCQACQGHHLVTGRASIKGLLMWSVLHQCPVFIAFETPDHSQTSASR